MNNDNERAIKGSAVLGLGAFISKLLGAFYRIPLLNIITSEGIGIYQMIFPVYCILLDFAGAGAPNAISKIVAERRDEPVSERLLKSSVVFLSLLGILFSVVMFLLSRPLSRLQGNGDAYMGYVLLSPAVLFVGLISCFRGYYQGKMNMIPTAVSQIIEQLVKLVFGLFLTKRFMPDIALAVGGATLAVSISEFVALIYLFIRYRITEKPLTGINIGKEQLKKDIKDVALLTIPFTLVGIAIPFSNLTDSFYVVNILKRRFANATSLYGIFSGASLTVISLPVSLCYGISVTAIPLVSAGKDKRKSVYTSLLLTFIISFIMATVCFFFSGLITDILFYRMSGEEKILTSNLIKLMSVNVVLLSMVQSQNAVLISLNKKYFPLLSMGIGILLKTVVTVILLNNVKINIYGAGVGLIACYFTAVLINFIMLKGSFKDADKEHRDRRLQNTQ